MNDVWLAIFIGAHFLLSGIIYVLLKQGILHESRAYIIIVILVPIFGFISLMGVEFVFCMRMSTQLKETMGRGVSKYRMIANDDCDNSQCVVPLEEALLIGNVRTRRLIMMDILHREPKRYIDLLKIASLNDDMEVTHYATTTIMEIQRDYDLSLQRFNQMLRGCNVNAANLDEAINLINSYISSGLLEGYALQRIREQYDEVLARKVKQQPDDKHTRLAFIKNKIDIGDFVKAGSEIILLAEQWPHVEEIWILGIRLAVEQCDKQMLDSWIRQMKQTCNHLSAQEKELQQFWLSTEVPAIVGAQRPSVMTP